MPSIAASVKGIVWKEAEKRYLFSPLFPVCKQMG